MNSATVARPTKASKPVPTARDIEIEGIRLVAIQAAARPLRGSAFDRREYQSLMAQARRLRRQIHEMRSVLADASQEDK